MKEKDFRKSLLQSICIIDMAHGLSHCPVRLRCSFRIATMLVCGCNVLACLYILQSLLRPLFPSSSSYPSSLGVVIQTRQSSFSAVKYTEEQLNRMKEAVAVWRAAKPTELIERVKEIQEESAGVNRYQKVVSGKDAAASGFAQRLKELRDSSSKNEQEALEEWRKKKLEEARKRAEAAKAKQEEYLS